MPDTPIKPYYGCPRCRARVLQPEETRHFGSPVRCAFDNPLGLFSSDNWNCATINALWDYADSDSGLRLVRYGNDESLAVLAVPEPEWDTTQGWVILTRYKRRGTTIRALVMSGHSPHQQSLTLKLAEAALVGYQAESSEQANGKSHGAGE